MRWVNEAKARYYQAELVKDLFGDWVVIIAWGGLGSRRGRQRNLYVPSYEAGLRQLADIEKRRRQRGYWRPRSTGQDASPQPALRGIPVAAG